MVFHLVNSDYRMTGTVAFQFKTFQRRQSGYQIVSNHVIVFTHIKVYIWGEYNPHKICLYTTDSCFIVLCAYMAGGGGGRRAWRHFFSCGNNCFYSLSTHPLVRGTARPLTQQSLISFLHSHSLCCHATPLAIARGHKKTADCKIIELELRKVFGQSSL